MVSSRVAKRVGQTAARRAARSVALMECCWVEQRAARLATPMECCSADQRVAKRAGQMAAPMAEWKWKAIPKGGCLASWKSMDS